MTRTTDEIIKPLPGQLAFRFMAEPGYGTPQATEQGTSSDRADQSHRSADSPGAGIRGRVFAPDGRGPPGAMMPSVPTRNGPGTFRRRGA